MGRQQPAVHRTVVIVDIEGFGDRQRTNIHQLAVRDGLYGVVRQAFDASGVSWSACDHEDRGDGVFILAPADISKATFVESVPIALAQALREHNATHPVQQRFRLRMALHAGEVVYDEHGVTAASINFAFRLLDSKPLKDSLADSGGVLAVITSEWFFDEVVRHSLNADPATFRPVRVTVKETSTVGWISRPDDPYPPDAAHLITAPRGRPEGPVPEQLPAAPRSFTGRADELATLTAALDAADPGGAPVITAIAGAGGMGKTWLALHWAHQHADRFPDGQLFVDLRGFSPDEQPMPPEVAVRGFLDAFGVDPAHLPVEPHAQAARYRSLVAGKRILIILDNAADTTQIAPLLPGSPACMVLITSRNRLPGVITGHGARHLSVEILAGIEARALLATWIGAERIEAEPTAVDDLVAYCGGLPLALSIVAGRAHTHPHIPLAALATELRDAGLGALDEDDQAASLPTVLSWSYRVLTGEVARMFGLLGVAPGPDISLPAAASLAGLSITETRAVLRGLERASLIGQGIPGRYRMHDLIRRYASDHAADDQTEADRETALRRVTDFYLHTAYTGARLLNPHRASIQIGLAAPGCHPHPVPHYAAAMAWFDAEQTCLLSTQQAAAAHSWHQAVWQMAWVLHPYLQRRGNFHDHVGTWQTGLAAADQLGDPVIQTLAHRSLGLAYVLAGQHSKARKHLYRALTLAEHTEDRYSQAHAHLTLAETCEQQGDDQRGLEHAVHALHLYQTLNSPVREAEALNEVGWFAARASMSGHAPRARPRWFFSAVTRRGSVKLPPWTAWAISPIIPASTPAPSTTTNKPSLCAATSTLPTRWPAPSTASATHISPSVNASRPVRHGRKPCGSIGPTTAPPTPNEFSNNWMRLTETQLH